MKALRPLHNHVVAALGVLFLLAAPVSAQTATLDSDSHFLNLAGKVKIDNSTGYSIETEALTANLAETALTSGAPVSATGPVGRITADSMSLTRSQGAEDTYLLVFKGSVKLVYQPE